MARIAMLTIDHSPIDDRIFQKEALSLKAAGHDLMVICAANPDGVVYDMGGTVQINPINTLDWIEDGIRIQAIKAPNNSMEMLLNKFFKSRFFRSFIEAAATSNAEVYHCHEPTSYYIGLMASRRSGAKVIFDSHECWEGGRPKEMWIRRKYLKDLRYLITANQITRGFLHTLNPRMDSMVLYNAADREIFSERFTQFYAETLTIAHEGYLPFNRGLDLLLDSFRLAYEQRPGLRLKIIGATRGKEKEFLLDYLKRHHLEEVVEETGWLKYEEVPKALAACGIGVITKSPTLNNQIGGPPIKYFNYTATGMAIIDVDMPETTRLLHKNHNGLSVRDRDVEALSRSYIELFDDRDRLHRMCDASSKAAEKLNWARESAKLVNFYEAFVLNDNKVINHL